MSFTAQLHGARDLGRAARADPAHPGRRGPGGRGLHREHPPHHRGHQVSVQKNICEKYMLHYLSVRYGSASDNEVSEQEVLEAETNWNIPIIKVEQQLTIIATINIFC